MRNDLTIIYYTSNRENEAFEKKIRERLVSESGGVPIISVSHKPIDFGENICVGDVGLSSHNCRRQFLIGAQQAKTKYVCTAESDFLYPEVYFRLSSKLAYAKNLYVIWPHRSWYFRMKWSDGAVLGERDYLIEQIGSMLNGKPKWDSSKEDHLSLLNIPGIQPFKNINAVITFKTGSGMSWKTNLIKRRKTLELPYWGKCTDLKKEYL